MRPADPPATSTAPSLNLVEPAARRGTASRTSGRISPAFASAGAPSGMPMSITRTSPAWRLPGDTHRPSLAEWNVAVAAARTAAPSTAPVEASTPLGTSAATTSAPVALIASIAPATGSRGAPEKPVPSSASTTAAAPSRAPAVKGAGAGPGRRARFSAGSPLSSAGSPVSSTSTSRPPVRSTRAATRPSPPLLPLPHTTAIRPPGARCATTSARPAPARSMRSSDGIPRSSIAQASTARICAASGSGSSQSGKRGHPLTPRWRRHPRWCACA